VSALFNRFRERLLAADVSWTGANIGCVAWSGKYWFDETDRYVSDIQTSNGTVVSVAEPNPTAVAGLGGYAITDPMLFKAVPIGPPVVFFTLVVPNALLGQSELIAYIDQGDGLPYTPNGLDMIVQPDWLSRRGWFRP
jgi:hypothetical protein